jgi:hypothetical protein
MPKIVQYNLPPGGTVVQLADQNSTALEIEGVDSKDYITVDTTDGAEILTLEAGGSSGQELQIKAGILQYKASGTAAMISEDPTATNPNFCPRNNDTDTGMGSAGLDKLSLISGGVEGILIVETGSVAHVGIGTTEPEAYSSNGNKLVLKSGSHCGLTIDTTGTNNGNILFATDTDDAAGQLDAGIQWTAASDYFRIYATAEFGNVDLGIGASGKISIGSTPDGNQAANNIYIKNGTAPSADPTTGGFLYVESGALKYRGSSATVTTIAAA